ncbi:MAG: hypothetical protein IKB56_00070 [Clostridia bacterium]|nr:hypothetical protein [Clostridia bacterium]
MKKLATIFIVLMMITLLMIGCTTPDNSTGDTPNDNVNLDNVELDAESMVKLLLAEERLNAALLKNKGDVFEEGVKVMNTLAKKAIESINYVDDYTTESATIRLQNQRQLLNFNASQDTVIFDNEHGGGKVTFNGENYLISDFVEVSNSYDSFSSTANHIAFMAEDAANLIDNIKKNVRIVDKWVLIGGFVEYYLHVGENEEILYERSSYNYKICRRYVNEQGNNVYEFLSHEYSNGFVERLTYIPGLLFETARGFYSNGIFNQDDHLICDNSKGYWETYWVGPHSTHVNVSYMVMKDDICYDSFYDPAIEKTNFLKIISADKTSDIFWYQGYEDSENVMFDVHFSGFNNIKGVRVNEIEYYDMGGDLGEIPLPTGTSTKTIVLNNGQEINEGDTFLDGKVKIDSIRTTMTYPDYIGSFSLIIEAPTVNEKLAMFKDFIHEVGLTSRHNIDNVISGVVRAFDELREITKYHVWNGLNQSSEENVRKAIDIENKKTEKFMELYTSVKDASVIDFSDKVAVELNAHFGEVSVQSFSETVHSGLSLSIGSLTLSISDTLLFIENQGYTINFALSSELGLVHLEQKTGNGTALFTKGETFSVTIENVTMDIPVLVDGEYKMVAYIATDDGIRSSAYTPFAFEVVDTESENKIEKSRIVAEKLSGGELVLTYTTVPDVNTSLSYEGTLAYEDLYSQIAGIACEHGIPSNNNIEMLTDVENKVYTSLIGDETEITSGVYRLAYNMQNGEKTVEGYIYVTLTVSTPIPTDQ